MAERKVILKKEDNADIINHLNNVNQITKEMNLLVHQRTREVKAANRVWESASLNAKLEGKLPMEVVLPDFIDKETLYVNIGITDGVAEWKEEPLKLPKDGTVEDIPEIDKAIAEITEE